ISFSYIPEFENNRIVIKQSKGVTTNEIHRHASEQQPMKFYCEKVGGVSGEIGSTPILPVLDATDTIVGLVADSSLMLLAVEKTGIWFDALCVSRNTSPNFVLSQEQHPDDFWDVLESVSPVVYTLHSFLL
ncbi:hypothetical protein T05_2086, partial [Trichinella murrelli]